MDSSKRSRVVTTLLALLAVMVSGGILAAPASAKAAHQHKPHAAKADANHDSIPDRWERKNHLSLKINWRNRDGDADGVTTYWEWRLSLNPRCNDTNHDGTSDGQADADSDGVDNAVEPTLGDDPTQVDTNHDGTTDGAEDSDGDGVPNAVEPVLGDNPADADTNDNGVSDGAEDTDGDGYSNQDEIAKGCNPDDSSDEPAAGDTSGDATGDSAADPTDDSAADATDGTDASGDATDATDATDASGDATDTGNDHVDCTCHDFEGFVIAFDGHRLVIQGWNGQRMVVTISTTLTVESFDPATGTWSSVDTSASLEPGASLHDLEIDASGNVMDASVVAD